MGELRLIVGSIININNMITEFKMLDEVKTLNASIKASAESSDRNSVAMKYLTGALVFLGVVQVIVAGLSYRADRSIIETKKNCYKSVLQTSNVELNYRSCLHNNGLSE